MSKEGREDLVEKGGTVLRLIYQMAGLINNTLYSSALIDLVSIINES